MKEQLQEYFNELDKQHKEWSKVYRDLKKIYGSREANAMIGEHKKHKNIMEQKLHIKRLLKLMNELEMR